MKKLKRNKDFLFNNFDISLLFNVTNDSYTMRDLDNVFTIFNSFEDLLYLVYSTKKKSIISFNLNKFQIITEIKGAHPRFITNLKHFFDKNNNKDLIMSISSDNCNIKIWVHKNWNCILKIQDIYSKGIINSASFIAYQNNIYIVASNNFWPNADSIKIINLEGNIIKKINNSEENSYYIDSYEDKSDCNLYIISCSYYYVISYNYIKNEIYHKYCDNNSKYHCSWKIYEKQGIIRLIESASDGIIRIWNFHSGSLLKRIYVSNLCIYGLYLEDDENIFVGCSDNCIKLININNGMIIKNIVGCKNWVLSINKINHEKYGNCLISQGIKDEQIKLWKIKIIE